MFEETQQEAFARWQRTYQRKAWRPKADFGRGGPCASRYGGLPWLAQDEIWPQCQHCRRPLQHLLQLNLADLPEPEGTGLVQLFYCTNREAGCEDICEAHLPFSAASLVRLVYPDSSASVPVKVPCDGRIPYTERLISSWRELPRELPWFDEAWDLLEAQQTQIDRFWQKHLDEMPDPSQGDKLGGWPRWIRNVEYPLCPRCYVPMELFFQLANDHLPLRFGDEGCGWLTRCPDHPDELAFSWESY